MPSCHKLAILTLTNSDVAQCLGRRRRRRGHKKRTTVPAEHVEQRSVFGDVRDNRPLGAFARIPSFGGELAGVVTAEDAADSAELEETEWRREKGSLMLGSKKVGKTGLVAEMPLSRTISAMVKLTPPLELLSLTSWKRWKCPLDFLELSIEG
ncbi:hypothetical protein RAB80_003136 [Fusarium oxysporum f. sp. vasinfectum]|nr:hypothetical protein RAB80_003136 [Fusarium oxysporum f. sp. vasinfectum]KAK2934224.1 hypothetical protein FoTM2_005470 [Fusarium oxysporum f. sp. vasinfectum]WKT44491.1 hypothetical protein QSH57_009344 [Fusarium oxysporum f. sp. vasinfectum]